ncbi:hypothetical protein BWK59_04615 [Flavobacterium davisii]|uniref:Uncharacterized protein n=1 Tax=Flavobacterium davisii TaxID=2906077 RepID=A0A246GJU9_9FLAO|nr:hypothetical protein [Flavobacterium davisii]OWP84594.1 hypothetical protein BWK59_04615 [Flavobacterium davisii]
MKKIILIMTLISLGINCKKEQAMQNTEINENTLVTEIIKNIKHYPSEKIYTLDYKSNYSFFEIFVNDIPVGKEFKYFSSSSAFVINPKIFKSGKAIVKFKMYPVGKVDNDIYNTLIDESYLDITLASYDLKNENASDIKYNHYKTPMDKVKISEKYSEEKFVGAGKTYYEGSFEIEVKVPYEIHPAFEKGKDLRKMDKKELEAKLLSAYQKVWNIYQDKEYDNIAKLSYENLKDQFITKYQDEKSIKNMWETLLSAYKNDTFQMQPIKDYRLVFFSDGKLVALMQNTEDYRYRGNTALWARVNHDGGMRPLFCNRYFYIPEGETEFKVY